MKAIDVYGGLKGGGTERNFNKMWEKWVLEGLPDLRPQHQKVLEVGAGIGKTCQCLKELDNFVIGADISSVVEEDVEKYADGYLQIDISEDDFPYENESFDAILCLDVLEHISNPYKAITEIKRICKTYGKIHFSIPNLAQQLGYGPNHHSVIYPGLFDVGYFKVFLTQMYLNTIFQREWEHPTAHTISNISYKEEAARHYYFVCENYPTKIDILKVVAGDYDSAILYDFVVPDDKEKQLVIIWYLDEMDNEWVEKATKIAMDRWPERGFRVRPFSEWENEIEQEELDLTIMAVVPSVSDNRVLEIVDYYNQRKKEVMVIARPTTSVGGQK